MKVERFDVNARRSRLVKYNGVCYLSGQFSDNAGDVATQTRETLAKIDELLAREHEARAATRGIWALPSWPLLVSSLRMVSAVPVLTTWDFLVAPRWIRFQAALDAARACAHGTFTGADS